MNKLFPCEVCVGGTYLPAEKLNHLLKLLYVQTGMHWYCVVDAENWQRY